MASLDMKRFWMEEPWQSWTGITRVNLCTMLGVSLYSTFATVVLIQLVPSSYAVGQECNMTVLEPCFPHEICEQVSKDTGVCKCQENYVENKDDGRCEEPKPPPEPSSSHLGLGLGLGLTFFLIFVVIALALVHHKFGLFSGMCDNLPRLHIFGTRGQEISLADNEDDVNPIV